MSAFEITYTPTRLKNKKRNETREPTDVIMAPFTGKAVVQFEDVPVTKTAKRLLRIMNPAECDIEVKVTKSVKPESNISLQWMQQMVPAQSEVCMELEWTPDMEIACKDSLQLTDDRNFRKEVMIILKSKTNKSTQKNVRKFPTLSTSNNTHVTTLRLKSPANNSNALRAARKNVQLRQKQNLKQVTDTIVSIKAKQTPLTERNTCLLENKQNHNSTCSYAVADKEATKENVSPVTPVMNVLSYIDNLKFTPASVKNAAVDPCAGIDSLAALPTPTADCSHINKTTDIYLRNIRPRRLEPSDLSTVDEILMVPQIVVEHIATPASNKTFNVKPNETIDISERHLDTSLDEAGIIVNKTTTIMLTPTNKALEMIQEEDSYIASPSIILNSRTDLQQTYNASEAENLKRDIKLVGMPLVKQSESMRELLCKSPSNTFGTQGSLPNLNEMEQIRSIEQNRYFYGSHKRMSIIHEQISPATKPLSRAGTNESLLNACELSLVSQADGTLFIQSEICAQSSRFNMHEVGVSSRRNSPVACNKFKVPSSMKAQPNKTKSEDTIKRRSFDISLSDTNSTDSLASVNSLNAVHARKKVALNISPPKRTRYDINTSFDGSVTPRNKVWSMTQPKKLRLLKKNTPTKKDDTRIRLYDSDLYMQTCINPDPFAATTTCDPFLASTMYLDARAVDKHVNDFKKWLNALVSIPAELDADCNAKIDVGKLFNEVRHKELTLATNKEQHSMHYHTKCRLESLRRAAVDLFLSEEMRLPCSKVAVYVNKNAIRIRNDRNLHLDVVTQRTVLELLLCFNPLWLRLGLEVVYGEKIQLQSNSDVYGLSTYILNRLFRDKFLEHKYSRAYTLSEEYAEHIKKFTLQKLLFLLLFLDKAKQKRIVKHNPCLFVSKSPHKETREVLLRISSELLANIGDVTRELRRLGYVLVHKQTFLDEFDYAFNNIAVDLRDGIRLTRIMEIILLRDDLTKQLRAPAISRLQRIHNVNLALRALAEANFQLKGDITAASIVDGHREKTLSLLWQIIYKFRSPKFHAAATVLQLWWRRCWLRVSIKRRISHKLELRRIQAATILQAHVRGIFARKFARSYRQQRTEAALVLQRYIRGFLVRRQQAILLRATLCIQQRYRAKQIGAQQRAAYLRLRSTCILLQRNYRRKRFSRLLLLVAEWFREARSLQRQQAANCLQRFWRNTCAMRQVRLEYLKQRQSIVYVQRKWRAKKLMQRQRAAYMQQRQLVINVQRRFRALQDMRVQQAYYQRLRACACKLQRRRRALKLMRQDRAAYMRKREAIMQIQERWRATLQMHEQRTKYKRERFVIIRLQQRWRATLLMRQEQSKYQDTQKIIIYVQQKWRAILQSRQCRMQYLLLQQNVLKLQRLYRAKKQMQHVRAEYVNLKQQVICMQQRYRAKLLMQQQVKVYQRQKQAVLLLQRRWRAYKQMRFDRAKYQGTRAAVLCLQQHFRSFLLTRKLRAEYLHNLQLINWVQEMWRGKCLMRLQRKIYLQQRQSIISVQQRYRANLLMKKQRAVYLQQRQAAIKIQNWYCRLRRMRSDQVDLQQKRQAVLLLQRHWRATLAMRLQRNCYQHSLKIIVHMQRKWRATLQMRAVRQDYQQLREACIVVQQRFRARCNMLQVRNKYLLLRSLIICLQRKYRAHKLMLKQRNNFLLLRHYTLHLQQKWRGHQLMLQQRMQFQMLRVQVLKFQAHARGCLARRRFKMLMTPEMLQLLRQRRAAKIIQRYWRGYRVRKRLRNLRLQQIRHNIAQLQATSNVVNSIRYKVQDSVRLLRGRYSASEALQVLVRLERLSRMVPHLLMNQSSFISTFCYGIMAQTIRSEVDKQLIEQCSRIILNLARYNSTTANTFQKCGLVTIAQMLLRWCDKECDIFNTLCTLIWIFAHCPKKRRIIKEYMTTPETIYMVRETKKLVARKEKMKQNARKPQQQQSFHIRALPSLEPDYGVIRQKPYIFVSSVYAFDTILYKLGIESQ